MNILIADDHALFRDTLHHYINRAHPGYKLYMASDLHEVVDVLNRKSFQPDLCILDYRMPGMKGCESFAALLKSYPELTFAVMSGIAEREDIEKVLALKVAGFLPKTLPGRVLLKAIETMLTGQKYIPVEDNKLLAPTYFGEIAAPAKSNTHNVRLTTREKEVLKLLCEGKSNRDIAEALSLKVVTIKLHVRGIFRKLACDNRTRAALRAKEWGILD